MEKASTAPPTRSGDKVRACLISALAVCLLGCIVPGRTPSKESVLKNSLFTLRTVIDEYTHDQGKAPRRLSDLVNEGYLRSIPIDPMTGNADGWRIVMEDPLTSANPSAPPGIFDVRSGSRGKSLDGSAYSEW